VKIDQLPFSQIWLHDFEFVARPGERPNVICLAARELRSGRRILLRRDQLTAIPPYDTGPDSVFVSFVANAECACHLALGWPLPKHVLDLNPAFRNITNGRITPEGKGLLGALRYYGLDAMSTKHKDGMRKRILEGFPFPEEEWQAILEYCAQDTDCMEGLLAKILADPDFDLPIALYHGEFAMVSATMEHHGVPIDELVRRMEDKDTWRRIRDDMVPRLDAQYGVYKKSAAGDWVFSMALFSNYLTRTGLIDLWPRTETGELSTKRKVFESMAKGYPQLEGLRQLRYVRDKMRKVKLAVGADLRNRTVLWPFKSKTSRTQPKASLWIFSPAVWLRSLIKPGPGMAVAYIDYSAMEFMIAASLSGDPVMLEMYQSSDPYLTFAKRVGAVPPDATKKSHAVIRDKYKNMLLSVQYGMTARTLAARLGVSLLEAQEMLLQHKTWFSVYWRWSSDYMHHAFNTGVMHTSFGWYCRTGITEFNERSVRNWPIQSTGADILRIACIMAVRHGIKLVAPVHDAVLKRANCWLRSMAGSPKGSTRGI
jgi:DNA polymerase I